MKTNINKSANVITDDLPVRENIHYQVHYTLGPFTWNQAEEFLATSNQIALNNDAMTQVLTIG